MTAIDASITTTQTSSAGAGIGWLAKSALSRTSVGADLIPALFLPTGPKRIRRAAPLLRQTPPVRVWRHL